jgi:hypothetical protein
VPWINELRSQGDKQGYFSLRLFSLLLLQLQISAMDGRLRNLVDYSLSSVLAIIPIGENLKVDDMPPQRVTLCYSSIATENCTSISSVDIFRVANHCLCLIVSLKFACEDYRWAT